jgi:hypothetical protein
MPFVISLQRVNHKLVQQRRAVSFYDPVERHGSKDLGMK